MDFILPTIKFVSFFFINLIENYGALTGVLITAGFTFIFYNMGIRDKNFFLLSEKYETNHINSIPIIAKLKVVNDEIVYEKGGVRLWENECDTVRVGGFYNLFSQMYLLWNKKILNRKLTYLHFSNILKNIYEKKMEVFDCLESKLEYKNLNNLYKEFEKINNAKKKGGILGLFKENFYYFIYF